ncbi:MAG: diaminopropionate ammonia-lyase [Steroidobacteraceae bacterium]
MRDSSPRPPAVQALLSVQDMEAAQREITRWPSYLPTSLLPLDGLARHLGLQALWLKDESSRFGIGSFKALGGAYAVLRLVVDRLNLDLSPGECSFDQMRAGRHQEALARLTVVCATDGNHGRAVAWGASQIGCRCVVYIHAGVSPGREDALRELGAEVVRTTGNYDDSVQQAARQSRANGWILVADTSTDAGDASPRYVMAGYTVLMEEAREQLAEYAPPTHIFVQAGVGGLAAAVIAGAARAWVAHRPRIVVVEPDRADCVFRSIVNDRRSSVEGSLDTLMAGLACGEVSYWAWPALRAAIDDVMTVPDDLIAPTMQLLLHGFHGDPSLVIGESGVAGLTAAIVARQDTALSAALGLSGEARVLVIGTEGATDQSIYRRLIAGVEGRAAAPAS